MDKYVRIWSDSPVRRIVFHFKFVDKIYNRISWLNKWWPPEKIPYSNYAELDFYYQISQNIAYQD